MMMMTTEQNRKSSFSAQSLQKKKKHMNILSTIDFFFLKPEKLSGETFKERMREKETLEKCCYCCCWSSFVIRRESKQQQQQQEKKYIQSSRQRQPNRNPISETEIISMSVCVANQPTKQKTSTNRQCSNQKTKN